MSIWVQVASSKWLTHKTSGCCVSNKRRDWIVKMCGRELYTVLPVVDLHRFVGRPCNRAPADLRMERPQIQSEVAERQPRCSETTSEFFSSIVCVIFRLLGHKLRTAMPSSGSLGEPPSPSGGPLYSANTCSWV